MSLMIKTLKLISSPGMAKIKIWLMEYQLKERIGGFTIMELFGPLLIVAIIIGIIQY